MGFWRSAPRDPTIAVDPRLTKQLAEVSERLGRVEKMLTEVRQHQRLLPAVARRLFLQGVDLPADAELRSRRFGVWSQNEEDGLLLELFTRCGVTDRRFIEIGCGVNGGNSGFLLSECGWSGLMVDARPAAVEKVGLKFGRFPLTALHDQVTRDRINPLVAEHGFSDSLDLLSIDVDGIDFWLWEALSVVRPRILVIEYNYLFGPDQAVTIPYADDFALSDAPTRAYRGASLEALVRLGRRKGYRLVATERINAFFVREDVGGALPARDAGVLYQPPANPKDVIARIARAGLTLVPVGEDGHPGAPVPAESLR